MSYSLNGIGRAGRQYVSIYLINGIAAIDAGCLGFHGTPYPQETIRHVVLTEFADQLVKSRWLRIQFVNRVFALTHTLESCVLALLMGGGGGQQTLIFSQAPNGESNDVNHTEPELFSQVLNEMKVRVREADGRRLEVLVLHGS